ncbi:hypothetical protein FA95DRAFT_1404941 [Auriscalpium vulgare]|uniref:Uncharacterized protein n=1 Tax=Auriscalpium vulgare TaxID=40419 RepID=A0ACB8RPP1_9AGAM|nr:hypothetical protein FA95DRAFT_1404941 [Auriscalpium vulgare]
MINVYDLINQAGNFKGTEGQKNVCSALAKQTLECGYFILDYCSQKSFWERTAKHIFSQIDDVITQYGNKFNELKNAFQLDTIVGTQLLVQRIFAHVQHHEEQTQLPHMPYAEGVRHQTGKQCLSGTRKELLDNIKDWIDSPKQNGPKICLLTGLSGTGKSSVAHSIAEHYYQLKRLGSSFCFNKDKDRDHEWSKRLFTTLAVDIAQFDPAFRHALVNSIGNNKALQFVQDLNDQVQNFIISPMQNLTFVGPIHCGTPEILRC